MRVLRRDRGGEESGFAIVMALLITAIVFVVMTGILAQAIHNVVLSGYGRRRPRSSACAVACRRCAA